MNQILALTSILFTSSLRRHAVWGICALAISMEVFSIVFIDFFGRNIGTIMTDFQLSVMWISGLVFVLFYAIGSISWGDNKAIESILARPMTRYQYVLGTWLGLVATLVCMESILCSLSIATIYYVKPMLDPVYFPVFNVQGFVYAWLLMQVILVGYITAAMLISSIIRGSLPVMLLTISFILICAGLPVVIESLHQSGQSIGILEWFAFAFPDYGMLNHKSAAVSASYTSVSTVPFVAHIMMMLSATCVAYSYKDIT